MDILIGFLIGLLCGLAPLLLGLLTKCRVLGIVGISVTALSGLIFALLDNSPFTAIGIAIIFIVILFAKNKKTHGDNNDHDVYMDDE